MQIMTRDKEMETLPEEQAKMMGKKDTKCLLKIKLIYFRNDFIKNNNGKIQIYYWSPTDTDFQRVMPYASITGIDTIGNGP